MVTTKSTLSKLIKKRKSDETTVNNNADLPPGITSGRATLIDAKLGKYKTGKNKGELFLLLAGTVISPKSHTYSPTLWEGGVKGSAVVQPSQKMDVKGLRTQNIFPLCETGEGDRAKSVEDNVANALNEIRKMGGDECIEDVEELEQLESVLELLVESEIVFKFSTSESTPTHKYPKPRIWENFNGAVDEDEEDETVEEDEDVEEGEEDEESDGEVEEDEENDESEEEESEEESEEDSEEEPEEESEEEDSEEGETDDLNVLASKADDGDEDAQVKIYEIAVEAGVDEDQLESDDNTWKDIVALIGGEESEEEEEDEEEEPEPPKKGSEVKYQPPKQKNKLTCIVTFVYKDGKKVNLKTKAKGTVHKGVLVSDLQ